MTHHNGRRAAGVGIAAGFVDHDRYTVALLTEDPRDSYGDAGRQTLTRMAAPLLQPSTLDCC